MNQQQRIQAVREAFLDGTGKYFQFFECVADALAQGCGADEIKALVQAARDGERDKVLGMMGMIEDV